MTPATTHRYQVVSSPGTHSSTRSYGGGATLGDALEVAKTVVDQGLDPAPVIYESAQYMLNRQQRHYLNGN